MEKYSSANFIDWGEMDKLLTEWAKKKFEGIEHGIIKDAEAQRDETDWYLDLHFSANDSAEADALTDVIAATLLPYYPEDEEPFSADDTVFCYQELTASVYVIGKKILEEILRDKNDPVDIQKTVATYDGVYVLGNPAEQMSAAMTANDANRIAKNAIAEAASEHNAYIDQRVAQIKAQIKAAAKNGATSLTLPYSNSKEAREIADKLSEENFAVKVLNLCDVGITAATLTVKWD